jgi:hypothetical protein
MLASSWGSSEDRASDRATAVHAFERPPDRRHWLLIERAFGMGRPSLIALSLELEADALRKTTIVGPAVIVSSGALEL